MSEKTEKPSPRRLREARRNGKIARSRPLAAAVATLFALATLALTAPSAAALIQASTRQALLEAGSGSTPIALAFARGLSTLFSVCLPVLAAALVGAILGAGLQVGVVFNGSAIGFKPEKLSPAEGFKNVFSRRKLLEMVKACALMTCVLWLAWAAARDAAPLSARLPLAGLVLSWDALCQVVRQFATKAVGLALAFGAVDYLLERHAHLKSLRMSREELRQEHKESEGDPQHKARRKAAHKALLQGTVARGVQKATVVIVNPTHVAVALRYDPEEAGAPTIVAKGVEDEAAKIRALARRFSVPMVRDVPLARALVRYDLGEEVPEELYLAAAAVLRKAYEFDRSTP